MRRFSEGSTEQKEASSSLCLEVHCSIAFLKGRGMLPPNKMLLLLLRTLLLPLTAHFLLLRKWSVTPLGYWKEEKEGMLETYSHLLLDELSKQVIGEIDSLMVKKFRVFPCLWNGWRGLLEKCILSKLSVFLRNVFLLALLSPEYVHLCLQHKFTGTVEAWGRKKNLFRRWVVMLLLHYRNNIPAGRKGPLSGNYSLALTKRANTHQHTPNVTCAVFKLTANAGTLLYVSCV